MVSKWATKFEHEGQWENTLTACVAISTLERRKVITVRYGSWVRLPPPLLSFLVFFPWLPPFLHYHSPLHLICHPLYSPCHSFLSPARHFLCTDACLPPPSSSHTNFRFKPCESLLILIVRPIVWETRRGLWSFVNWEIPDAQKLCSNQTPSNFEEGLYPPTVFVFFMPQFGVKMKKEKILHYHVISIYQCVRCLGTKIVGLFLQLFIYFFIGIVIG